MCSAVKRIFCVCVLFAASGLASAQTDDTQVDVIAALQQSLPYLQFGSVVETNVAGYYQVEVLEAAVPTLFVNEDASHFFSGDLFSVDNGQVVNVSETIKSQQRREKLAEIDLDDMIVFSPEGETLGVLNVFTDVTCGYCRRLHQQISEMNAAGIEVRYLAYPRSGLARNGAPTHEFIETSKAWCADDRKAAMTALKAGASVEGGSCEDSPVAAEYALGRSFGVTGTPAIVLEDGTLMPGYRSTADFARILGIEGY